MNGDDRFCPLCEVTLELHSGPDSCSAAQAKADLMDGFFGAFPTIGRDA